MFKPIIKWFKKLFTAKTQHNTSVWQKPWSEFLNENVSFYRNLSGQEQSVFHQRIWLFLETTSIEAGQFPVTDEDRLLVAASAIIPVWSFPRWHYFNLDSVYLLPAAFNAQFECGQPDSVVTGMVGTGPMAGKMALCKAALYQGFQNDKDKHNVGIHEFVHLIDMADGECDGYPERLKEFSFSIPWFELAGKKIQEIDNRQSNIPDYGATNRVEFFAVASEYFFERPKLLKTRHPKLFRSLSDLYRQESRDIAKDIKIRKKALCPCGSKKRYKRCCMPSR